MVQMVQLVVQVQQGQLVPQALPAQQVLTDLEVAEAQADMVHYGLLLKRLLAVQEAMVVMVLQVETEVLEVLELQVVQVVLGVLVELL